MKTFEVVFLQFGKSIRIEKGRTILEAAREADIPIESPCGGRGECGKCRIRILSQKKSSIVTEKERRLLTKRDLSEGLRLACLTKVYGDMSIEVAEEALQTGFVKDKKEISTKIELFPAISIYSVKLSPPSFSKTESDLERIKGTLKEKYGLSISKIDPFCFKNGPLTLRREKWNVNVVVWMEKEILDIRPITVNELYGLAIDIGTTTIGAYLLSLKDGRCLSSGSILNPQIRFGEDIMSRIAYISKKREKGLEMINQLLIKSLNSLIDKLSENAGISKEDIVEVTVVGNTVMHHIFLKIDPSGLGVSPFIPFLSSSFNLKARDMGIKIHPSARIHVLPLEAGFVGADNVGVILALKPYLQDEWLLIIDIGTNGEIVIGNRKRLVCASCATGPALEGAHIRFGMRAKPGAIEKIRIDAHSRDVEYRVIGNVKPRGICGSGVIDAISELFKASIIESSGKFRKDVRSERLRRGPWGKEFVIAWAKETAIGRDITITQQDIRNVQLAKAAIYAGSKILLKYVGVERPSKVILTGSFGSYIDIRKAYRLGLFPFTRPEDIITVGNAAGGGAVIALLNREEREEAEKIARRVEYVELTLQKEFQREFLDALYIPHRYDPFFDLQDT